jgi:AcrR family transcriptional regulator
MADHNRGERARRRPANGLRARKVALSRDAIRSEALRLFLEQGYEATSMEQIAAAAIVSERTCYRHFATKADLVLFDHSEPPFLTALARQPAELTVVAAIRGALADVFATGVLRQRARHRDLLRLVADSPELRRAMLDRHVAAVHLLAGEIAARTGRPGDDPPVCSLAGAIVGAGLTVTLATVHDPRVDLVERLDATLAQLDQGLRL